MALKLKAGVAALVAASMAGVLLVRLGEGGSDEGELRAGGSKRPLEGVAGVPPDTLRPTDDVVPVSGDWAIVLDEMMQRDIPNDELAVEFAEILPSLPPEGQGEAAWRMAAMLPDELYHHATRMYLDQESRPEVVEAVHENLLLRGDDTKLYVLAEAVEMPGHRFREAARSELKEILGVDHGYHTRRWAEEVDRFLDADSPDD